MLRRALETSAISFRQIYGIIESLRILRKLQATKHPIVLLLLLCIRNISLLFYSYLYLSYVMRVFFFLFYSLPIFR